MLTAVRGRALGALGRATTSRGALPRVCAAMTGFAEIAAGLVPFNRGWAEQGRGLGRGRLEIAQ